MQGKLAMPLNRPMANPISPFKRFEFYNYRPDKDLQVSVYPFVKYKGWTFLRYPCFLEDVEKQLERIRHFDSRENDILLCTYPKTGTHWVYEIICMLVDQTTEYNSRPADVKYHLDFLSNFDDLEGETTSTRRIVHSHLPFRFLPKKHVEKRNKIVFVNRNPKDRHVSQYNFFRGLRGTPPNWTWEEYCAECVFNDTLLTGWFNYTREMIAAVQEHHKNIHMVLFEDLKLYPQKEITKLAEFLEVPYNETFINDIVDKCTFKKFKDNKIDGSLPFHREGKSTIFRKGDIGDWKNWFTVDQNEQFDAMYSREMKSVNIDFIYESPMKK